MQQVILRINTAFGMGCQHRARRECIETIGKQMESRLSGMGRYPFSKVLTQSGCVGVSQSK